MLYDIPFVCLYILIVAYMNNITVIGAGTMGNGIAHVFAQHGYNVILCDISTEAIEKGMSTITKNLDRQVKKEKLTSNINVITFKNIQLQEGENTIKVISKDNSSKLEDHVVWNLKN